MPTTDAGLEAMKKLSFLVGEWKGTASMRRGPGEPARMTSRETVGYKLGGRVLVVEGLHELVTTGEVVHQTLGVFFHDAKTGDYRFRTWLAQEGREGEHRAQLENGALLWFLDSPNGAVRYTIRVEGDTWKEIGEIDRGGTWSSFFEMTLTR
jgi:hypothetical protein